jgi:two-component system response regulator YesN
MLKLLVVDDEPIIRSGISGLIEWEKYGYEICGEAEDGPSAVEVIQKLKPDLVLLDLHLPGFSGLEVIKKIRADVNREGAAANNNAHFIVISGYSEFEYVKEAINLEVDGYIVKPIEENILIERITSIAAKIKMTSPQERMKIQFLEIIEGVYNEKLYGPFCFNPGYVQAVFVSIENISSEDDAQKMQVLTNFFQKDICHKFSYREFIVFLFENTQEVAVKRMLENLCNYLDKFKGWTAVTLGSRCMEDSSGSGIRKTFLEAEELMKTIFFYSVKKYLSIEDIQNRKSDGQIWDNDQKAKELCSYIQIIDTKKIQSFFQDIEAGFFHSDKTPEQIRQECMALMIETRSEIIKKIPALREKFGTGKEILDAIMRQRYLKTIIDTMTQTCLHITELLPLLSADSSFQRIISYVKNNYYEDLRLESLGQLFYYNCAYLGKRFKEYTGKNFHTYLDMIRVDAAKDMLQNTDMKVYEISSAVGYTNTDYFYSKFKKYTGKSPLIFRKNDADTLFMEEK